MGLTKAQLEALNDSSFPNNNAGAITPAILRDYNTEVILNTVNQDVYTTDSASFDSRIDALTPVSGAYVGEVTFNNYTASTAAIIAGLETTASFNTFSSSYVTDSASFNSRINAITSSGTINTSSFATTGSNTFNGNQIITGSLNVSSDISSSTISGLGNATLFSSSVNSRINSITSSGTINTGSFATTGSNTFIGNQTIDGNLNVTGSLTASGLKYPTTDGTFTGQVLQTNAAGTLSFGNVNAVFETIHNGEATTITVGTPLYVSGALGSNPIVYRADATNPAKMPVTFVAMESIATNQNGRGITLGLITGINMTGYPVGTALYTDGLGQLTATRPTGSNDIVQPIGIVTKTGSGGQLNVLNPGPVLLPNIQTGYTWVGNGTNQPVNLSTASLATTGSNIFSGSQQIGSQAAGGVLKIGGDVFAGEYGQYYLAAANGASTSTTYYASQSAVINIGAVDLSGGAWDTELYIESTPTSTTFKDWNGSGYNTWLTIPLNTGTNPRPRFNRGLEVTGSTQILGSTAISGSTFITGALSIVNNGIYINTNNDNSTGFSMETGSFQVTSKTGSFYTNLPITSSGARINGKFRAEEIRIAVDFAKGNGNLYVEGNTYLTGALWVSQSAVISSSLNVVGTITASGNISSSGNIYAANLTGSSTGLVIQDDGAFITTATALSFGPNLSVTIAAPGSASVSTLGLATTSSVNELINKTGSYATTGSNTFVGTQIITGSVNVAGGNEINLGDAQNTYKGVTFKTLGTNNGNAQAIIYASQSADFFIGAIADDFSFDSELYVTTTNNGIFLKDWDNNINNYSTFLHVPYNTGTALPGFDRGFNVTGSALIKSGSASGSFISNVGDTFTGTAAVTKIISLSSAEYSGLATKDSNTLYIII